MKGEMDDEPSVIRPLYSSRQRSRTCDGSQEKAQEAGHRAEISRDPGFDIS